MQFLIDNPLFVLFLVAGIGYPLGKVRLFGVRLGVAMVLFVGLAFGALNPGIKVPEIVNILGLVLFIYTIGLSSGSVFLDALRTDGMRANGLVLAGLLVAAAIAAISHFTIGFELPTVAGLFAGATTNTPALAAVIEKVIATAPADLRPMLETQPIVAYSLTYPLGVLGMFLVITLFQRAGKIATHADETAGAILKSKTVRVNLDQPVSVANLIGSNGWEVLITRIKKVSQPVQLVSGTTILQTGDKVTLVGTSSQLEKAIPILGVEDSDKLDFDVSQYDSRRMFLSNPELAGRRLKEINLSGKLGVLVTRIRRGDLEFVPRGNSQLVLGDQLKLVGATGDLEKAAAFFGDSYRMISEINILALGLGVAFGLLVGSIPIPLPGGVVLKLGVAGGPLLVSLLFGSLKRTGPIVWDLPYGANLTIRQIGLVLFLAGVGTRAGYMFFDTLLHGNGYMIMLVGALITMLVTLLVLLVGTRWFKLPFGFLAGMLAGLQTQPAVLGFSNEQFGESLPALGYATVFPFAMVAKIILAQLLLLL